MTNDLSFKFMPAILKQLYKIDYLTQDLFYNFHNKQFE
jgi:hypothetical protein